MPAVAQDIALRASPTASSSTVYIFAFPIHSTSFVSSPLPATTTTTTTNKKKKGRVEVTPAILPFTVLPSQFIQLHFFSSPLPALKVTREIKTEWDYSACNYVTMILPTRHGLPSRTRMIGFDIKNDLATREIIPIALIEPSWLTGLNFFPGVN